MVGDHSAAREWAGRLPSPNLPSPNLPGPNLTSSNLNRGTATRIRVKIRIPSEHRQEPVISRLISEHRLLVNITGAKLEDCPQAEGWFDLELHGTPPQLQQGLAYLQNLDIQIWGKPNPDGDSWS
ncbi:NIL domain-containing protein [Leptolyngbya sp. FACHB-261]|nr:NIL domain-containing protein [Leptolyngbya sp. FACHB-261]